MEYTTTVDKDGRMKKVAIHAAPAAPAETTTPEAAPPAPKLSPEEALAHAEMAVLILKKEATAAKSAATKAATKAKKAPAETTTTKD